MTFINWEKVKGTNEEIDAEVEGIMHRIYSEKNNPNRTYGPTIKEVFEFCDKMDSIGDIHITKTPAVIKNFYGIGLFEATEIFNCWVDIKKINEKYQKEIDQIRVDIEKMNEKNS